MLSALDNERLAHIGPGTEMGALMRRYWIPFLLTDDIPEADGDPVRVTLLGERLVAFRNSVGQVGLVDRLCAHRNADLFFGRNEENGIRCTYHAGSTTSRAGAWTCRPRRRTATSERRFS